MNDNAKLQLEELKGKVQHLTTILASLKKTVDRFELEYSKQDYTQVEGVMGKYDGKYMTSESGEKFEVPSNYAAKSKLVFGDVLKLIEEDGKKIFKHIEKVDRLKLDGILTKKEGEWYVLTDRGSYKVSDVAAEFQKAQLNSEATILLPAKNLDAPFATIDTVVGFEPSIKTKEEIAQSPERPVKASPRPQGKSQTQTPPSAQAPTKPQSNRTSPADVIKNTEQDKHIQPVQSAPAPRTVSKPRSSGGDPKPRTSGAGGDSRPKFTDRKPPFKKPTYEDRTPSSQPEENSQEPPKVPLNFTLEEDDLV